MGNPYAARIAESSGTVRIAGDLTFTDPANQPGGGSPYISNFGSAVTISAGAYGTKFDNTTDDTAAIQQALNDAASANPYGASNANDRPAVIVQLPPGRARINTGPLLMPANVWLRGHGPTATYLVNGSTTADLIALKTGAETNVYLTDFGIIGAGTPSNGSGISLQQSSSSSILGDARHVLSNLLLVNCYFGLFLTGSTELRVDKVGVYRAISKGMFVSSTDCFVSNCTVAQPGDRGFDIRGGNTRVWGCKGFGGSSGQPLFVIAGAGRDEVTACEAQDGAGDGFNFAGNFLTVASNCIADSCSGAGFSAGSDSRCLVALDNCATVYRAGGHAVPTSGVRVSSLTNTTVRGFQYQDETGTNPFPALALTSTANGQFEVNNARGWQTVAYAASITPDPWVGGTVQVGTITGNLTLVNPAPLGGGTIPVGSSLLFMLPVDGVGGYTLAFGASYKLATSVPLLLASTVVQIGFSYDGTNWRETGRTST